ncbi:MAG: hypothetical protein ABI142_12960 [Bryocella sp.]
MRLIPRLLPLLALFPLLATGCHATPSNPLVGSWKLTADGTGPQTCYVFTTLTFTKSTQELFNKEGVSGGPALVQYVVQLPNVFVTNGTAVNAISYTMQGADTVVWHSPYGPCTYTRQ